MEKTPEEWDEEMKKCAASPYYFFTTYYQIDDKPATTHLTEEQFNKEFKELQDGTYKPNTGRNRYS